MKCGTRAWPGRPGLVTLAVVGLLLSGIAAHAQSPAGTRGWLVVPFDVASPSARTYWLGEGLGVLIGDELQRVGIGVLPREVRVEALDELRLPSAMPLTRATYIRVGELLGAPIAVFGRIATDESELTITARRLDLDTGQMGPDITEQGKLVELFAIGRRVAQRISGRDAGAYPGQPDTAAPPLEAFEAYVKALLSERPEVRVRLLDAALAKAPTYDPIRLALWGAHADLDDAAKALAAVEPIADTSPDARTARFLAARSLIELRRYDDAFATLKTLADSRPDAAVLNNLGVIQVRRGWTPQTGRPTYYFNKAAELEPDDADLFFNLGYSYLDERDSTAAIYWLREAVRRNPADADAHYVLAIALETSGSGTEAARERTLAQHLSDRYADGRRPGGDLPRGLERLKDSMSWWHPMAFDTALKTAAQSNQQELVHFHLERARRFFEQHRDGDAEPELRRVLFLAPYHAEAHLLAGRLFERSGRVREALASFRISIWSEPSAAAYLALAEALVVSRDVTGGRDAVMRALALEPAHPQARALLAQIDSKPQP